jgi:DNA mismatch repair protein MutS2
MAQARAAAEEDRRRASVELERAERAAQEAEEAKAHLETERHALQATVREQAAAHARVMAEEAERAYAEVSAMLTAVRNDASLRAAEQARIELAARREAAQKKAKEAHAEVVRAAIPPGTLEMAPGKVAHHVGLERDVDILEVTPHDAIISAGPLKMRVPLSELVAPRGKKQPSTFPKGDRPEGKLQRAQQAAPAPLTTPTLRCDVRGMRADEALREVESFLDRSFRAGDPGVLILHGHGTGALKQAIRDSLAISPYVRAFRPGESHEGGDGVTVVTLAA